MTRDLFSLVFSQLSQFTCQEYDEQFTRRLPIIMLRGAVETNPGLTKNVQFSAIHTCLSTRNTTIWKNPEIYPHLILLQNPSALDWDRHLRALSVHLNLAAPSALRDRAIRFLRLRGPRPRVFRMRGSKLVEIPDVVCASDGKGDSLVYRPYSNLFSDVAKQLYRGTGPSPDLKYLSSLVTRSRAELEAYSPELSDNVSQFVSTLVFTNDDPKETRSFSMQLSYLGGIFTAICEPPEITENIIHEYYHIRLRAWWLLEKPEDPPPDTLKISSPITGMTRTVSVMMQALLIYVSLIDFYRWYDKSTAQSCGKPEPNRRVKELEAGTNALIDVLYTHLTDQPISRRYVSLLADIFKSICR